VLKQKPIKMKHTGHYCNVTSEYDLDHVINKECDDLKRIVIAGIDDDGDHENKKAIIKAMIATLLDEL